MTFESKDVNDIVDSIAKSLDGIRLDYRIKKRPDGDFLIFEISHLHARFYDLLSKALAELDPSHPLKDRCTISVREKKPLDVLNAPESKLLIREISSSLTVDKNTFGEDFLSRYIESVTGLERDVVLPANYAVYGRRGSGKSSLLAYGMHNLKSRGFPYAWVAMQTYAARSDRQTIASVFAEIFSEARKFTSDIEDFDKIVEEMEVLAESDNEEHVFNKITRLLPRLRRVLGRVATNEQPFTIFLDDLHVLSLSLQPELLHQLYAISRGNCIYIKISGIEQLTNLWNSAENRGLEPPHDIQTLALDNNLTNPDQSKHLISNILNRHANYCGISSIEYLCAEKLMDRLVLSAAAVPRDAMSLFVKSMNRSILKKQKQVSVTSLNAATSEAIEEKLKDVERDISKSEKAKTTSCLESVKEFCLTAQKRNAFLVKISNKDDKYKEIQRLAALRFVHLLHEGITRNRAGERYIALMLDYGFYIGIRAAKSITLFPESARSLTAKELRTLPVYQLS